MKNFVVTTLALMTTFSIAHASTVTVRCSGVNQAKQNAGFDIEIDSASKKVSAVTSWEADSTYPYDLKNELFNTDAYLETNNSGGVRVFIFSASQQGGSPISAIFVEKKENLNSLDLPVDASVPGGSPSSELAHGVIACKLLK